MKVTSPYQRRRARIEIIPLIDIMFFLLATFIMVSLSMIQNRSIPLRLPAAATSTGQPGTPTVTIALTADGNLFWDKDPIARADLVSRLAALLAANPDPEVSIHGDRNANFGPVVQLLDEVRKAGVKRVAIQTEPEK